MNVVTAKELTVSNQLNLQLGSYGNMDTDVLVALGERKNVWILGHQSQYGVSPYL